MPLGNWSVGRVALELVGGSLEVWEIVYARTDKREGA